MEAEQQYVSTGQRVRKEFEAKLEEVRRAGEEDIHLRMDAGTKRIMQQNRSLQEELRIHIEVTYPCCCCAVCLGYTVAAAATWDVCYIIMLVYMLSVWQKTCLKVLTSSMQQLTASFHERCVYTIVETFACARKPCLSCCPTAYTV